MDKTHPTYRTADVGGFRLFYREAGDKAKPMLLHLVAPDLPSSGLSIPATSDGFTYSMLDLFLDYRTNVELYPVFQRNFRERRPKLLAIRGQNDPSSCHPAPRPTAATSRTRRFPRRS